MAIGKVFLVGAGPGDPDLITIKAHKILKKADIIFHDALIDGKLLGRYTAEKVDVGKRKKNHKKDQDQINQLLYDAAADGKIVARLKGGDPMIFSRGAEEITFLEEKKIPVEVIPGITSSLAASSLLKIPLTKRGVSSSILFCTGHPESSFYVPEANAGTILLYMAASNLKSIMRKLVLKGWDPKTHVRIVSNVSNKKQKQYKSTISGILNSDKIMASPVIVFIGKALSR